MKDKMEHMMGKKKGLSDLAKKAKMGVVKDMQKMASDAMGSKLSGLKKVSVMSPDKEGLKQGLEKAEELIGGEESEEGSEEESDESCDSLEMCDSVEKCDELIAKLEEKKKQLEGGSDKSESIEANPFK